MHRKRCTCLEMPKKKYCFLTYKLLYSRYAVRMGVYIYAVLSKQCIVVFSSSFPCWNCFLKILPRLHARCLHTSSRRGMSMFRLELKFINYFCSQKLLLILFFFFFFYSLNNSFVCSSP